jgi:hypothetical protein
MKLSTGSLVAVCVVWLGLGCTRETEFYCCTDPAVCSEVVSCPDRYPDRPVCDMAGDLGMPRLCQADPSQPDAGVECSAALPCGSPLLSQCSEGICAVCESDEHCGDFAQANHCKADVGCVACTSDAHCGAASPVCEPSTDQCRGCASHDECGADGLCQDDGACVPGEDIFYVDVDGDGAACTATEPCKTIGEAVALLSGTRRWIKVAAGTYGENLTLTDKKVNIVGEGATILPLLNGVSAVLVSGTSKVYLEGLRLTEANRGLRCTGADPVVPAVVARRLTIDDNDVQGVDALECDLTIERSTISGNAGGGLRINDSSFVLLNNVVAKNGGPGATFGGLSFNAGSGRFEFNTVADNQAAPGLVGGVQCVFPSAQLFKSSIVAGNQPSDEPQASSNCSWIFSDLFGATPTEGQGNLNVSPLFVDSTAGDYHLTQSSPCRNVAQEQTLVVVDIDGDPRPATGADMGADETQP